MLLRQSTSCLSSIPKSITSFQLPDESSTKSHYVFTTLSYRLNGDLTGELLSTQKSTPPPLTSPPLALSQPSKKSCPLAINLNLVELIFSTSPTSPHLFFDSLEDLPPQTTNPPPLRLSFDSIERLANQPPPLPAMKPPLPPLPP
ncbi:hypothetical protein Tco_0535617 [Tanacetum coccineum]